MVDREDIDALLIGRLYGELSSADEARLQAHLGSGTSEALADRRALEDMTHARSAVRESRLLAEQAEPPQSISALLMQEAARRAPKPADEQAGWFARFVRSFMMHPAMAAAAMLVVVVGVAGALYSRKGDHFAAQQKDSTVAQTAANAPAAAPAPLDSFAAGAAALQAETKADGLGGGGASRDQGMVVGLEEGAAPADDQRRARKGGEVAKDERPQAKPVRPSGIEVTTPQAEPKEFDRADDSAGFAAAPRGVAKSAPAPDPAPVEKAQVTKKSVDADARDAKEAKPKPVVKAEMAPAPMAPPPPPTVAQTGEDSEAWARTTHKQVVAQARANRCDEAATTAESIAKRARGYYDANVQHDRDLKGCMTLIAQRREQAETAQRAKAAKKSRTEPAAKPPAESK